MESNKSVYWKAVMNGGAILGIAIVIVSVIFYVIDIQNFVPAVMQILVTGGILFYLGKNYRESTGGSFSYGQSLGFMVLVCAFSAIITAFYTYLLMAVIDPGMITKILDKTEAELIAKNLPEAQIEQALNMTKKFMTPAIMTGSAFLGQIFYGTIISLIVSAFVKKDANPFENKMA
jgi:hypothetical protein